MKPEQERVRNLLTETVTLLCKNGLNYGKELKVQGLLGITLDDDDVFVVHINEKFVEALGQSQSGVKTNEPAPSETSFSPGVSTDRKNVSGALEVQANNCPPRLPSGTNEGVLPGRQTVKRRHSSKDGISPLKDSPVKLPRVKVEREEAQLVEAVEQQSFGTFSESASAVAVGGLNRDIYMQPNGQDNKFQIASSERRVHNVADKVPPDPFSARSLDVVTRSTVPFTTGSGSTSFTEASAALAQVAEIAATTEKGHGKLWNESLAVSLQDVSHSLEDVSHDPRFAMEEFPFGTASGLPVLGANFSPFSRVRRDPKAANKPHLCEYPGCHKSFFRRAELNRHQRWKHGGHFGPHPGTDGVGNESGDGSHGSQMPSIDNTFPDEPLQSDLKELNDEANISEPAVDIAGPGDIVPEESQLMKPDAISLSNSVEHFGSAPDESSASHVS